MAPRAAVRREPANVDYSAVGKMGRRTGVTLDQQPLDAYGMEQISGIFSSPRKPSPLKNVMLMETVEESNIGTTPKQPFSAARLTRGTPASTRLPRSSSPRKSGISGTARKSNGVDIFSARKSSPPEEAEDRENTPIRVPTPTPDQNTPPIQPTSTRTVQKTQPRRFDPSPQQSPLRNLTTITPTRLHKSRASLAAMRQIEESVAPSIEDAEFDDYDEAVGELEPYSQSHSDALRPIEHTTAASITPGMGEHSEEPGDNVIDFDDSEPEQTPVPEQPAPSVVQNQANSRKKRKSDVAEHEEPDSPRPSKFSKKGRPAPVYRSPSPVAPSPKPLTSKAKGKQPLREKDTNVKLSPQQEKEIEEIVEKVKARPGPPRSLYILRRETPADDGVCHTRSGRISVKPLAYWRNERCVYGSSPSSTKLAEGARFPLNSIKEIVRTEEVVDSLVKGKTKGKKKNKGQKQKAKARPASVEDDESSASDYDLDEIPQDPDAEPWETDTGTLRGNVAIWDNTEQAATDQEMEIELAHAPAAIKTREIKGTSSQDGPTFRYAKLLSTGFCGTGLVDLPPGGIKRPKNSRKMHMSFFVVKGRVTVTVGPPGGEETGSMTRFSIGKGGFWQVPRGNEYSIENEMDKSARIFFSQGSEPEPVYDDEDYDDE